MRHLRLIQARGLVYTCVFELRFRPNMEDVISQDCRSPMEQKKKNLQLFVATLPSAIVIATCSSKIVVK